MARNNGRLHEITYDCLGWFQEYKETMLIVSILTVLFGFIVYDQATGAYPWPGDHRKEWDNWMGTAVPQDIKALTLEGLAAGPPLKIPFVIIREFKWPYEEERDEGEGPWLFTNSVGTGVRRREMLRIGMFAHSPAEVRSIVWLSLEESAREYPGKVWRGPSPLSGTTPMSVDRTLMATVIDLDANTITTVKSWDCSYAIVPSRSRLGNESSIEKATTEMDVWLYQQRGAEE